MRMKRKGQAALEFLTTYGWAFLVILIMIGALAYFGVLSPSKFLPDRCNFPPEFSCTDHLLTESNLTLKMIQNLGKTIQVTSVQCTYEEGSSAIGKLPNSTNTPSGSNPYPWKPKEKVDLFCDHSSIANLFTSGNKGKLSVIIKYKKEAGGFEHTAEGELYATVQ